MLSFIMKWMPLVTIAAGSTAAADKLKPVLEYTRVVAVQVEVNEISKMLTLDHIGGDVPDPSGFSEYLRKNMRAKEQSGQVRDTALDMWGTAYQLETLPERLKVSSAGPDRRFGTSDDIYAAIRL